MKDASVLAARFFRDLADIFDGKGHAVGKCAVSHGTLFAVVCGNAPRNLIFHGSATAATER